MDFLFRKSNELSLGERRQLCGLFQTVFAKEKSDDEFCRKFLAAPAGPSYHGLMLADNSIVGSYSVIPYPYLAFGRQPTFGLDVDTMIHPDYRGGPFNVKRMADLVYLALMENHIPLVFAFPNDNIFEYRLKIMKWVHLGDLDYYVLPLRLGTFKPALRWLNLAVRLAAACYLRLPRRPRSAPSRGGIRKVDNAAFRAHRYGEAVRRLGLPGGATCFLRIHTEEDGVRAAYILDVDPLTETAFRDAVKAAYHAAKDDADLILYVGNPAFKPQGLIRLPKQREPKPIRMCCKILLPDRIDRRVLDFSEWELNISNFDVR